jgi:hypothetical protein
MIIKLGHFSKFSFSGLRAILSDNATNIKKDEKLLLSRIKAVRKCFSHQNDLITIIL